MTSRSLYWLIVFPLLLPVKNSYKILIEQHLTNCCYRFLMEMFNVMVQKVQKLKRLQCRPLRTPVNIVRLSLINFGIAQESLLSLLKDFESSYCARMLATCIACNYGLKMISLLQLPQLSYSKTACNIATFGAM